jgi:hypothetical protein
MSKPATAVSWTGAAFTGWSDVGTITKDIGTTRRGCLYLSSPNNSGIAGIRKTAPGLPDTLTARFDMHTIETSNNAMGIMFCEASPGRIVYLSLTNYGANDVRVTRRYYTAPGVYVSEATYTTFGAIGAIRGMPIWLRLTATSNTSFTSSFSQDGTEWITIETAFNPGAGTYTDFGYMAERNSGSGGAVKLASPWYDLS